MLTPALTGPALDRLLERADLYGVDAETMLDRLLARDDHQHQHRCPTCARRAAREHDEQVEAARHATLLDA